MEYGSCCSLEELVKEFWLILEGLSMRNVIHTYVLYLQDGQIHIGVAQCITVVIVNEQYFIGGK